MQNERDALLTGSEKRLGQAHGLLMIGIIIREAMQRLLPDEAMSLAGNIAFRTILSIFPFLIFLTSLASYFGTPSLADEVVIFLLNVAPTQIVKGVAPEIHSILTVTRPDLMSLSVLLTIWTASAGIDSLRVGLNRAYDLEEHRSFLLLFVQNILFVIVWAAVLMLLALLIVLAPTVLSFTERYFPALVAFSEWIDSIRYPVTVIVLLIALLAAHMFLPARWHISHILPGVVLTLIVWLVLAVSYSYFLAHFATFASTYAGLAGLIVALYFIYLSGLVFIFGGEVNRAIRLCHKARQGRLGAPPPGRDKVG